LSTNPFGLVREISTALNGANLQKNPWEMLSGHSVDQRFPWEIYQVILDIFLFNIAYKARPRK